MDENDIETTMDDLMSILKQGDFNIEFGSNNFTILVKTTKDYEGSERERIKSIKYHSLCASATLYPGKTLEEVKAILDELYPDETKSTEGRDPFADSE